MGQLTLEYANREDLAFLLSFAKRLNVNIISVVSNDIKSPADNRRAMLQQAANDPLFLADIADVTDDFKHINILPISSKQTNRFIYPNEVLLPSAQATCRMSLLFYATKSEQLTNAVFLYFMVKSLTLKSIWKFTKLFVSS